MTAPWLSTPAVGGDIRAAIASAIPVLQTERLALRAPRLDDWPGIEPNWTGPRAAHIGGPFNAEDAYFDFCQAVASWTLRGFGPFVVTLKGDDTALGTVGIFHDYGDPEAEAGWIFNEAVEGQGYATEAARAVLDWARDDLGLTTMVSFIAPENAASIRVAEKLGAMRDDTTIITHVDGEETLVYRHDLTATNPRRAS